MNKERLTEWVDNGEEKYAVPKMDLRNNGHQKCCNKLANYEDLDEQGLLLRLPCKVGDDVYYILGAPKVVCCIEKTPFELSDINRIGKDLFLTRLEAEKKLRELEGKR